MKKRLLSCLLFSFCLGAALRAQFFHPDNWLLASGWVSLNDRAIHSNLIPSKIQQRDQQKRRTDCRIDLMRIGRKGGGLGFSADFDRDFSADIYYNQQNSSEKYYGYTLSTRYRQYLRPLQPQTRMALFVEAAIQRRVWTDNDYVFEPSGPVKHGRWSMPLSLGTDVRLAEGVWLELTGSARFFTRETSDIWFRRKTKDFVSPPLLSAGVVLLSPFASLRPGADESLAPRAHQRLVGATALLGREDEPLDLQFQYGRFLSSHWLMGGQLSLQNSSGTHYLGIGTTLRYYLPLCQRVAAFPLVEAGLLTKISADIPENLQEMRKQFAAGFGAQYMLSQRLGFEATCSMFTNHLKHRAFNAQQARIIENGLHGRVGFVYFL